jgi:hypothetical protein
VIESEKKSKVSRAGLPEAQTGITWITRQSSRQKHSAKILSKQKINRKKM